MDRCKVLKIRDRVRVKRKRKIRARISGSESVPRITVFKSNKFFYAQAIDDINGNTLCAIDGSTLKLSSTKEGAKEGAKIFSKQLKDKNIDKAVFDRNGYLYYGVVAEFADAIRENGISI
jgi:large subunit ribosomal protein L18